MENIAMAQANALSIWIGPYGLHLAGAIALVLFAAFLWVFNFTSFF